MSDDTDPDNQILRLTAAVRFDRHVLSIYFSKSFPITPYTEFLLENFPDVQGHRVLDFGTGCGVLALAAALGGAKEVVACDVSDIALKLTQENSARYDCKVIRTLLVDEDPLMGLKGFTFDTIICNPASLPTLTATEYWAGGSFGLNMIYPLIDVAAHHLLPGGRLRFVHTSLAPLHRSLSRLVERGLVGAILQTKLVTFRPFYEGLSEHFADLRAQSQIFYDERDDGTLYELLYIVDAKHFDQTTMH
jgi:release factor glutamine methyltransferase